MIRTDDDKFADVKPHNAVCPRDVTPRPYKILRRPVSPDYCRLGAHQTTMALLFSSYSVVHSTEARCRVVESRAGPEQTAAVARQISLRRPAAYLCSRLAISVW